MKFKKAIALLGAIAVSASLVGCGNKADYNSYKEEVKNLYNNIVSADAVINSIDVDSPNSKEEFFNSISKLKTALGEFKEIDAPKEFDDCEYLSGEAYKYLETAEENFHAALDGEYDDAKFQTAVNNYNTMVKCVNYMGDVLQNKDTPDEIELNQELLSDE